MRDPANAIGLPCHMAYRAMGVRSIRTVTTIIIGSKNFTEQALLAGIRSVC